VRGTGRGTHDAGEPPEEQLRTAPVERALRSIRERAGWTQQRAAKAARVCVATVRLFEIDRFEIRLVLRERLLRVYRKLRSVQDVATSRDVRT
jgi:DNA-binding XRE family transcriptional regulator